MDEKKDYLVLEPSFDPKLAQDVSEAESEESESDELSEAMEEETPKGLNQTDSTGVTTSVPNASEPIKETESASNDENPGNFLFEVCIESFDLCRKQNLKILDCRILTFCYSEEKKEEHF